MAFDDSGLQQEDDQQNGTQAGSQGATQLSGGGGGFAGQGGTPGAPGSLNQQPSTSGSWTNLNSYLDANQDQAPALGQAVAGAVGTQAAQAQGDLAQVQSGYQNQAPYQALNNTTGDQVDQAFANPSQYAPTTTNGVTAAADTTTPENYLNNSWGLPSGDITQYAPTSGKSWNDVNGEYVTANQNLQNTQSESGRGTLLQNQYGQNGTQYNQGEQNFDQLLLEQNPSNQSALNSVYSQYAPGEAVTAASSAANPAANGQPADLYNAEQAGTAYNGVEQAKALKFQNQAQGDLGNQISGLGASVTGAVANDNTAYNQLVQDFKSGHLTPAEQQQAGIQAGPIQTYGVDPNSFINANPYAGTNANNAAASSQDWNNFAGLNALVGGYTGAGQATAQSQLGQILQGSPSAAPSVFNNSGFNTALSGAQASYNAALNDPSQTVNYGSGPLTSDQIDQIKSGAYGSQLQAAFNNLNSDQVPFAVQSGINYGLNNVSQNTINSDLALQGAAPTILGIPIQGMNGVQGGLGPGEYQALLAEANAWNAAHPNSVFDGAAPDTKGPVRR